MYATRSLNRDHVTLPDGRRADKLRLSKLQAELAPLKIPGITPEMGKDALLTAYEAHVNQTMPSAPSHPRDLARSFLSRARALIDHADSRPPSLPPAPPIATTRV